MTGRLSTDLERRTRGGVARDGLYDEDLVGVYDPSQIVASDALFLNERRRTARLEGESAWLGRIRPHDLAVARKTQLPAYQMLPSLSLISPCGPPRHPH
jgi:hypothetical protein